MIMSGRSPGMRVDLVCLIFPLSLYGVEDVDENRSTEG
jgi:hypothetical protein